MVSVGKKGFDEFHDTGKTAFDKIACHQRRRLTTVTFFVTIAVARFSPMPFLLSYRQNAHESRTKRRFCWAILGLLTASTVGCRTTAPIHLWRPPAMASVSEKPLVLMEIAGPADTAEALRDELLAETAGNPITLLVPEQLDTGSAIQLVSGHQNEPSDLAIASAARRSGVAHMLRGEIVHATGNSHSDERLSVVWRLVGLSESSTNEGVPVSVDQSSIQQRHPDLMWVPDPQARLRQAMVRETVGLLDESVVRQRATLAHPRFRLGSAAVRRGNRLAEKGDWPAAERIWEETIKKYPGQTAAWINASIAGAARQDFEEANRRVTNAIRLSVFSPLQKTLAEETLVWLELRQRDYHQAFDLPDPPGGWRVTQGTPDR